MPPENNCETMVDSDGGKEYITQLNKNDVLCGRGSGPNERVGNINFRDIVQTRKAEYLAINPRDHSNKNRIAQEIVDVVRSSGGRFLKRAAVPTLEGEPEKYELVDEMTVLEKAKQALRQSSKGKGAAAATATADTAQSHVGGIFGDIPPAGGRAGPGFPSQPSDPMAAFMQHLQKASMIDSMQQQQQQQQQHFGGMGMGPAGGSSMPNAMGGPAGESSMENARMENARMQNYMAAQRLRQQQQDSMPGQNPYFPPAPSPGMSMSPGPGTMDAFARMQQEQEAWQHYEQIGMMPNTALSGNRPNNVMSSYGGGGLADEMFSDYNMEQMQRLAAERDHLVAASLLSRVRDSRYYGTPGVERSVSAGNQSISEDQIKALENLFVSASQKERVRTASIPEQPGDFRVAHKPESSDCRRSITSEPFIDGLEDMSLPSMSIGEISDLSWQERVSTSRSKMSVGGTIAEGAESDSANDSASHPSLKPEEMFVRGAPGPSCLASGNKQSGGTNRHVSFMGKDHKDSSDDVETITMTMESSVPPRSSHSDAVDTLLSAAHAAALSEDASLSRHSFSSNSATQKKQRKSLSSYYREIKESDEIMSLSQDMSISQQSEGTFSWMSNR